LALRESDGKHILWLESFGILNGFGQVWKKHLGMLRVLKEVVIGLVKI